MVLRLLDLSKDNYIQVDTELFNKYIRSWRTFKEETYNVISKMIDDYYIVIDTGTPNKKIYLCDQTYELFDCLHIIKNKYLKIPIK